MTMDNADEEITRLKKELSECPNGYISRKKIQGKDRYYWQWLENGRLRSRYIKEGDLPKAREILNHRLALQEKLKEWKATPEAKSLARNEKKADRNLRELTGWLMSGDIEIARVDKGQIVDAKESLLPFFVKRTRDVEEWIASRAIDRHRTNSRLLKRVLRLKKTDDFSSAIAVYAATITDRYWFRPEGSGKTYRDIRFSSNAFDELALRGDSNAFALRPAPTPELTNIGSFEKCWKRKDGFWWLVKRGNPEELFSELFICRLGEALGFPMAHYDLNGDCLISKDFTDGASVNFEPMKGLTGEDDDYQRCFETLFGLSPLLAKEYLRLIYMDTLCFNMDRHTENFGVLRDAESGNILALAPNFDNNIALISRGYPKDRSRKNDGLIRFFAEFLEECPDSRKMYREMKWKKATPEMIEICLDEIPIPVDRAYICDFILNGQRRIQEIIGEGNEKEVGKHLKKGHRSAGK